MCLSVKIHLIMSNRNWQDVLICNHQRTVYYIVSAETVTQASLFVTVGGSVGGFLLIAIVIVGIVLIVKQRYAKFIKHICYT